ncbi:hypothetical protein ACEYW6_24235 [Nostoc sp. UIC 10607]|uniref:hypothetical protein n=1 Tax=Nostoc sp. UIC 10607 TaxID=3045935 RepID=UPI0039A0B427
MTKSNSSDLTSNLSQKNSLDESLPANTIDSKAPFEDVLGKGIEKLTSEIFIFLLCYTMLLIGIGVFGTKLATELRTLLYILPVLGVGPYFWLRRQQLTAEAQAAKDNLLRQTVQRQAEIEAEKEKLRLDAQTQIEKIKAETDQKIAGLQTENLNLNMKVEQLSNSKVLGTENAPKGLNLEQFKIGLDAKDIKEGSTVVGLSFEDDDLIQLFQELDKENQNDLRIFILHLKKINKENGYQLRSLIKDIQELNDENRNELRGTVMSLRQQQLRTKAKIDRAI